MTKTGQANSYRDALALAAANLLAADVSRCAVRAEAESIAGTASPGCEGEVGLTYLGERCRVRLKAGAPPEVEVVKHSDGSRLAPADALVVLHYLLTATGSPLVGKSVSFQELWGGRVYIDAFRRRAIQPWVQLVGRCGPAAASARQTLAEGAASLGAAFGATGDLSLVVPIFPRLRLTYVYWEGDEELEPSGNILFDAGANDYLPTEDLAYVASVPIWRLGRIVQAAASIPPQEN